MTDAPSRRDVELTFNGKLYRVRPTFDAITNLEGALMQPARSVGMKAYASGMSAEARGLQPEISLSELAVAVFWMLKSQFGKGDPDSPKAVGEILMEDGYSDLLLPVGQFLTRAQRGHKLHEKEAEEAERKAREALEAGADGANKGPTQAA